MSIYPVFDDIFRISGIGTDILPTYSSIYPELFARYSAFGRIFSIYFQFSDGYPADLISGSFLTKATVQKNCFIKMDK